MISGIFIGILIGVITGIVALVLLRSANAASLENISSLAKITAEILAIPTFWFGGPWIASELLKAVPKAEMIDPYVASLTTTFVMVVLYPTYKWIMKLAGELSQETRRP